MTDDIGYFEKMTFAAKEWADWYQTNVIERDEDEKRALALGRIQKQIVNIILDSINNKIESNKEYDRYNWMKADLRRQFRNVEIINVTDDNEVDLFTGAEQFVGNQMDFWEGYFAAKAELGLGEKSGPSAAAFWKNIVWPKDYYYSRTMAARKRAWGEKSPWWYWLEFGTKSWEGAHPDYDGTGFLALAQEEATQLLRLELEHIELEEFNIVEQTFARYEADPTAHAPGDELDYFYANGIRYLIYVRPTGKMGVAQRIRL